MKDALERIRREGRSSLLCELVERVKENEESFISCQPSVKGTLVRVLPPMGRFPAPVTKARRAIVRNAADWMQLSICVEVIVIMPNCCNEEELRVLDLRMFLSVREMRTGDDCFGNVEEVLLIGLGKLERVAVGKNCFMGAKSETQFNPNGRFCLKECPKLRVLKIGCMSFSDYSLCEMDTLASLEVIEMGELDEESDHFFHASLELKSDSQTTT